MKTILFIFIFSSLTVEQVPLTDLIGKWKLEKIETNNGTIIPRKIDYFLNISEKAIGYNLEINNCSADSFFIDNKNIILNRIMCTLICCDGNYDTISNYINYSGTYKIHDSLLEITNDKGKLFLKKE